jgi:SAM-dependent methyltransferase
MPSDDAIERGSEDPYAGRTPTRHERLYGPWDESYRDGPAPWDTDRPQPAIVRVAAEGGFAGTVLDAGCGTGEHALLLAARGHDVLGLDVAATAIERARRKASDRDLAATFLVADALQLGRLGRTFDSVLDVGLFHTFDDDEEPRAYVDSLTSVTRPGSVLHLLCFSDAAPGDRGPRRISQAELRSGFATGWTVVSIAAVRCETRFDPEGVPAWLAKIGRA